MNARKILHKIFAWIESHKVFWLLILLIPPNKLSRYIIISTSIGQREIPAYSVGQTVKVTADILATIYIGELEMRNKFPFGVEVDCCFQMLIIDLGGPEFPGWSEDSGGG